MNEQKSTVEELISDKSNIDKRPYYVNKISGYLTARCSDIRFELNSAP
jgi:ribosomal protein S17E